MKFRKLRREIDPYDGPLESPIPSPEEIMNQVRAQAEIIARETGEEFEDVWKRFEMTGKRLVAEYHPKPPGN